MKQNLPVGKTFRQALEEDIILDSFSMLDDKNVKTYEVTYHLFESIGTGIGYSGLTGKFLYRSICGNEYILVAYHYNENAIPAEPVKKRYAVTMLMAAWAKINKIIKQQVCKRIHILWIMNVR